jgi:CheY-like chemotaxis protein
MSKILIVDDNEMNLIVLQEMINILELGIEVDNFINHEDVLKQDVNQYDLILSDIDMPILSGFDLLKKLREEKKYKKPIIAVTAFAVAGDEEKILMHGFSDYISKPIDMNILQEKLLKFLGQK